MTKELRRCPFCGGEVKTCDMPVDANTISRQFSCSNCGMVAYFDYSDEEESIEAWNRREPIDKIVGQLEDIKMRHFLTMANTGDDKLDLAYEYVGNALDTAIEIVKGGAV